MNIQISNCPVTVEFNRCLLLVLTNFSGLQNAHAKNRHASVKIPADFVRNNSVKSAVSRRNWTSFCRVQIGGPPYRV
jgi:hypothetical protein